MELTEAIHQGINTTILLEQDSQKNRICVKTINELAPSKEQVHQLENEFKFGSNYQDWPFRKAVERRDQGKTKAVAFQFIKGENLQEHIKRLDLNINQLLTIAQSLVAALVELHKNEVAHLNLNSSNIIVEQGSEKLSLIPDDHT